MRTLVQQTLAGWLLALAFSTSATAQIYESAGTRAQGMGGAFVAVADDASATWWNPAGIGPGAYFSAIAEYSRLEDPAGGLRSAGIAAAFPALGLSYYRVSAVKSGFVAPSPSTAAAGGDRKDLVGVDQFGASVGQSVGDHLVVATTLKLLHGASHFRGDLDAGAMLLAGRARVGLVVKNVVAPRLGEGPDAVSLPRQARAGMALAVPGRRWLGETTVAIDADLSRTATVYGDARHLAAGAETWVLNRRAGMRGGMSVNTAGSKDVAGSVGVSVALRSGMFVEGQVTAGADRLRRGWGFGARVTF
jgi:hypothetical protein